jgi:uncharacterized protein (TIGR03435 family)
MTRASIRRNGHWPLPAVYGLAVAALLMVADRPVTSAQAQAPSAAVPLPAFDVVSVKPHLQNDRMIRMMMPPDGISVSGITLHMILREALGVSDDRLLGEPGWVGSYRCDIDAKVDAADAPRLAKVAGPDRWAMLLPVLVDRFSLKYHYETRDLTVYVLVVAKGGPKLQASKPAGDATRVMPGRSQVSASSTDMVLNMHGATSGAIARMISLQIGSIVLDKTGLMGKYDYTLEWAPDENAQAMLLGPGAPKDGGSAQAEDSGPSIFTAVQEQLGLKLEAQKQRVDVVVIDHIDKPSPN